MLGGRRGSWAMWGVVLSWVVLLAEPQGIAAEEGVVDVADRAALIAAMEGAKPGMRIRLAAGEYRGGLVFSGVRGTAAQPFVLEAREPGQPPLIQGGTNCMHLRGCEHLELKDLVLQGASGNGLNIDDGGDGREPAQQIRLTRLQVRDIGPQGNHDGIKMSGIDHFIVADCTLERWGERGSAIDMVGCHDGEIRNCTFRFRSDLLASGVQTKGGCSDVAVRGCRFEHAGTRAVNVGGSTGREYFRPRDANFEARRITVEDCLFIGSQSPIAFVGVDGATVRFNTIYRPTRWVLRILQETQAPEFIACRNGVFANNIVVYRAEDVRTVVNIGSSTQPETFRFADNHWYCLDQPLRSERLGLPTPEQNGTYGVDPGFRDPERGDFELRPDSPVRQAGVRPKQDRKP